LEVTSPNLEEASLDSSTLRARSYKNLKVRVHPDKHNNDSRATNIFQNLHSFHDMCLAKILRDGKPVSQEKKIKRGQNCPSKTSTNELVEFDVRDKWNFLHIGLEKCEAKHIPKQVAFQCINAREAIAHRRKIKLTYKVEKSSCIQNVEKVFLQHSGSRNFEGIDAT